MTEGWMGAAPRTSQFHALWFRGGSFRFVLRLESGLHFLHGLRKTLGIVHQIQEKAANVERCAGKLTKRGGERRAARAACRRDEFGEMESVQAASREWFMRILQKPSAVVAIQDHVGG